MKNILILGGLGFIGSNIIDEFLNDKDQYSIIVFDFPGMVNIFGNKVNMVFGDFSNEEAIESVFKEYKIDIVIHLISTTIPASSNDSIVYDIDANLVPTIRLLNLLVKYRVERIVFLSSGGTVYGITNSDIVDELYPTFPISSHGVIKLTIEKYIHLFFMIYGINYLILRVGNAYGPYQKSNKQGIINVFLRNLMKNEKLIIRGDGNAVRDYIYVKDVALIVKQLLVKNIQNEIINIGSGQGVSVNQIVDILRNLSKQINVEYSNALNSDIPKIILNTKKLKSLVEYKHTSIEDGILQTYSYLISEIH